ncbi:serine protease [Kitasatospora sp. MAP5-34]|uniref:serine protease n=1 Tax=Kitasatospora sp. MAP5-34 TaxID=3035102 RepID=UPI0024763348|nr:serine protease [Kitasatospora sp. MAP5-34]MDH6579656.1 hypothetical protein [Kitasatospora sp. MAP5-34]
MAGGERALLRICDPAGRVRGLGFVVDLLGTVLTAHETVAGLTRLVLHTPGGQTRVLGPDSIEPLPACGLALLRTDAVGGLPVPPLPVAPMDATGRLVAVPYLRNGSEEPTPAQGGVLSTGTAMYPWADVFHLIEGALLLDLPQLAGPATPGAPVLDAETGAVLAVVAPRLRGGQQDGVAAAPLAGEALAEVLAQALARNAATVPAYGRALNLGGVLQLASVQLGTAGAGPGRIADLAADRVDRPDGLVGEEPPDLVTVLLGAAGSGRTTELAALTVRRAGGPDPLPTLWLRGADLAATDTSLAAAVGRELARAAGLLAVESPDPTAAGLLCAAARRPLLVVLDAPEEAPAAVSESWYRASAQWLDAAGARLLTACRPEEWGRYEGALTEARVRGLGPLPGEAADRAARRYGLPPDWLAHPEDAAHPLALRLAGELHAAGVCGPAPRRSDLFAAYLDLCCLRVGRRLVAAAEVRRPGAHRRGAPRPAAEDPGQVRRQAAVVAGRLHEAARQLLVVGHGGLGRPAFDALFPAEGGWAQAVLAEGLFVPAGAGYRPGHEEFAEWLQGLHLDLDGALRILLDEAAAGGAACEQAHGVPRHRIGLVLAALRRLGRTWGAPALDPWLHRLRRALEAAPPGSEPAWWAGRLLSGAVAVSPDLTAHSALLEWLAERGEQGGEFGPAFWAVLPLDPATRLELLRRLVRTDGAAQDFRAVTAELLGADPHTVLPLLCRWLADGGRLPARPGSTVADLAHDLLYAHRSLALDDLTECLVTVAHPRADALLSLLAVEEPSALCRAVDRWSHDPRPERHVAAAVHALRTAPYATGPGPGLLRFTALTLLAREDEPGLHGAALALLVLDPQTRARHLAAALAAYSADDPFVTAEVLGPALASDPGPVLAALRRRLALPGAAVAEGLRVLADAADPETARQGLELATGLLRDWPERAAQVAEYLDRLLARAAAAGPLLAEVAGQPAAVRRVFAVLLAGPGQATRASALDVLLAGERDPLVLTAVLERIAETCQEHEPDRVRELVRAVGMGVGGEQTDAALVRCAGRWAAFAGLLAEWPTAGPALRGGPLLARMRVLVAAGRDPQYAAAEAERAATGRARRAVGLPVPEQGQAHGTL